MSNSQKVLKLLDWANQQDPHPFARLKRGQANTKGLEAVAELVKKGKATDDPGIILLQGAFYVCFDCFKEAHQIAQDHEGMMGNWLHAILHRREPDAENSKYWYARVLAPENLNEEIGKKALALLKDHNLSSLETLTRKMEKSKMWETEAFVDLCEKFGKMESDSVAYQILAKLQHIEWRCLVEFMWTTSISDSLNQRPRGLSVGKSVRISKNKPVL